MYRCKRGTVIFLICRALHFLRGLPQDSEKSPPPLIPVTTPPLPTPTAARLHPLSLLVASLQKYLPNLFFNSVQTLRPLSHTP